MITINTILLFLALICFLLAAIGVPSTRINLLAAGLFLWVLAVLLGSSVR
jgi:hypothetical protein